MPLAAVAGLMEGPGQLVGAGDLLLLPVDARRMSALQHPGDLKIDQGCPGAFPCDPSLFFGSLLV